MCEFQKPIAIQEEPLSLYWSKQRMKEGFLIKSAFWLLAGLTWPSLHLALSPQCQDLHMLDRGLVRGKKSVATKLMVPLLFSASVFSTTAAAANAVDVSIYQGDYRDPLHPYCERHITVDSVKSKWFYSGTDVGPKGWTEKHGCSKDEITKYGLRHGAFEGEILPNGRLSVGDGVHEAIWEPANTALTKHGYEEVDGVRFDDSNKWVRYDQSLVIKDSKSGQYIVKSKDLSYRVVEGIFLAYIGFSTLAGAKGVVDAIQRKKAEQSST